MVEANGNGADENERFWQRNAYLIAISEQETAQFREFVSDRVSPTLSNDPSAQLDLGFEVNAYLDREGPEYRSTIEQFAGQISEPIEDTCEAVVVVAAASHQEGNSIYRTLESRATGQKDADGTNFDASRFEVVAFLNRPSDQEPDATADEIQRFKNNYPDIRVCTVEHVYEHTGDDPDILHGEIMKHATDIAAFRTMAHPGAQDETIQEPILISNDADTFRTSPFYFSAYLAAMRADDNTEGALRREIISGKIEWAEEALYKFPEILAIGQFGDHMGDHFREQSPYNIGSSGANFAIRPSAYAAIGGYDADHGLAADQRLSDTLEFARIPGAEDWDEPVPFPVAYSGEAWLQTDPRRAIGRFVERRSVANQWEDFDSGIEAGRDPVRDLEWEDMLPRDLADFDVGFLAAEITYILEAVDLQPSSEAGRLALEALGVTVEGVVEDGLTITDMTPLLNRIVQFRNDFDERQTAE